jgi:hypothetical protein
MTPTARPFNATRRDILDLLKDGAVTVTRKVTPQPPESYSWIGWVIGSGSASSDRDLGTAEWGIGDLPYVRESIHVRPPFGPIGARFWAREAWGFGMTREVIYMADDPEWKIIKEPARTMPREYSRFDATLTALRVEKIGGAWYWVGTFEQVEK